LILVKHPIPVAFIRSALRTSSSHFDEYYVTASSWCWRHSS